MHNPTSPLLQIRPVAKGQLYKLFAGMHNSDSSEGHFYIFTTRTHKVTKQLLEMEPVTKRQNRLLTSQLSRLITTSRRANRHGIPHLEPHLRAELSPTAPQAENSGFWERIPLA